MRRQAIRTFLPFGEIGSPKVEETEVGTLIYQAIQGSDLVVAHLVDSSAVGLMLRATFEFSKPTIPFYRGPAKPRLIEHINSGPIFRTIPYSSEGEAVEALGVAVRDFYDQFRR